MALDLFRDLYHKTNNKPHKQMKTNKLTIQKKIISNLNSNLSNEIGSVTMITIRNESVTMITI